jgi:triosephosphate isomerase
MAANARKPLIAGNWKMHGVLRESRALVDALCAGVVAAEHADMLLCPPFVYVPAVAQWIRGTPLDLGAQDVAEQVGSGAYTGEVSGAMLRDVGCRYVIVGHSERRSLFGESDERVVAKFRAAQQAGLIPILCVGESLEEREAGRTQSTVERQVKAVLDAASAAAFASAVIAYEPIWAIGTGRTATPTQAQEVHAFIRGLIAAQDATIAGQLRILYGGSVKGSNAGELLAEEDIDGGLVGGASLQASEFLTIFHAAAR